MKDELNELSDFLEDQAEKLKSLVGDETDGGEPQFYLMSEYPEEDPDMPGFSFDVIVYTRGGACDGVSYYDFHDNEWVHSGNDAKIVCWSYIPDPKDFIKNNNLQIIEGK